MDLGLMCGEVLGDALCWFLSSMPIFLVSIVQLSSPHLSWFIFLGGILEWPSGRFQGCRTAVGTH